MAAGSDQFISEVRIFPFQSIPQGWLPCDGRELSISDPKYTTLCSLIGDEFGDGNQGTYVLPDLRGVVPMGVGAVPGGAYGIGDKGGEESVVLIDSEMPSHNHTLAARGVDANASGPHNNTFARAGANL